MLAIIIISVIFALFGLILGYSAHRFKVQGDPIVDSIDALLPQTQCAQCGYPGCRPYASAIAAGEASFNQCPPGGDECIMALSELLGVEPLPLNEEYGQQQAKRVAAIVEKDCIGCALCIPACPVDAIVGAARQMHTVIRAECTGCDLCVPACPVDCIIMMPNEALDAGKAINSLSTTTSKATIPEQQHLPCIRCGECEPVCPVNLLPQQLYWHCRSGALEKAKDFALHDCIECGRCETVCPSNIPLVQYYHSAKSEIVLKQQDKAEADHARTRYLARQLRIEQENIDRMARIDQKKKALAEMRSQEINKSIARVKTRRQANNSNHSSIPPHQS